MGLPRDPQTGTKTEETRMERKISLIPGDDNVGVENQEDNDPSEDGRGCSPATLG